MWKPSKKTLFFLMLSNTALAGISLAFVDWIIIHNGKGIYQEIATPLIFFCLAIYFVFPYVSALKKNDQ